MEKKIYFTPSTEPRRAGSPRRPRERCRRAGLTTLATGGRDLALVPQEAAGGGWGTSRRDLSAVVYWSVGDHTPPRGGRGGRGVVLKATSGGDLAAVPSGPVATIPPRAYHLGIGPIPPRPRPIPPHRPEIPPPIPPPIPPQKRWYWGPGWARLGLARRARRWSCATWQGALRPPCALRGAPAPSLGDLAAVL